jgi:cell division protein FtsW
MGVLFLGGINARIFSALVGGLLFAFSMVIWLSPWRRERVFAYLDPWNPDYAQSKAYQLSHSLMAIGRGEWTGVGLGGSVEKLHYLPEAHTDFIVAVIGEELGFIGIFLVVALFSIIIYRCFEIGRQAIAMERVFGGLIAQGVGVWRTDIHQYRRVLRFAADKRVDLTARQLRRFRHFDEFDRDRSGLAR